MPTIFSGKSSLEIELLVSITENQYMATGRRSRHFSKEKSLANTILVLGDIIYRGILLWVLTWPKFLKILKIVTVSELKM